MRTLTGANMYSHLYEIVVERARRYPSEPALGSQEGLGWRVVDKIGRAHV